jgi:hypothetical protein
MGCLNLIKILCVVLRDETCVRKEHKLKFTWWNVSTEGTQAQIYVMKREYGRNTSSNLHDETWVRKEHKLKFTWWNVSTEGTQAQIYVMKREYGKNTSSNLRDETWVRKEHKLKFTRCLIHFSIRTHTNEVYLPRSVEYWVVANVWSGMLTVLLRCFF